MTKDVIVPAKQEQQQKKRKIASLDRRKARAGWFFVLPFILGFVLIYLPMVYDSLHMSFCELKINGSAGYELTWVGLENYEEAILVDPSYAQTLVKGLGTMAFQIPAILIFSLFMAVMLNQKATGRGVFRAIFFIPVILSTGIMESVAASDIMTEYMEDSSGIDDGSGQSTADNLISAVDLEFLFSSMKVGTELVTYVTSMINDIYDIVNRSGVQMLIFLAALQGISPAIYESCKIDGATSWETFWKITFPMISPMIIVNGVYTIIDSFTADNAVMNYINTTYSESSVLSSAMAWIYFVIVILIVALLALILSGFVYYDRKSE